MTTSTATGIWTKTYYMAMVGFIASNLLEFLLYAPFLGLEALKFVTALGAVFVHAFEKIYPV